MSETYPTEQSPDIELFDGESFIKEKTYKHPDREFTDTPSSLKQMLRLTKASTPETIGENGPSIASLAFEVSAKTAVANGESPLSHTEEIGATPEHLRLYEVVFGRDSLRVAIDLISSYPSLARATTYRLAELQGVGYNTEREEEPGRIVHEARDADNPIAVELTERLGWGWPYYGSVDATPEFIRTLTAYCRKSEENSGFLVSTYVDKQGNERTMAYAMDQAVNWIISRLNANPEGLLEFKSVLPKGIENQAWKDSWDAYHHKDGTLANHSNGIASIEIQVTTYDALLDASLLYRDVLDDDEKAKELIDRAAALKEQIISLFWTEDEGGYFVLGTDRDEDGTLRQLKIKTSNMGHVLNSRLLEDNTTESRRMTEAIVKHILSPRMLNVSGVRTLSNDEAKFRPGAYHNGSVWLWDTHHIAKGLRRHGYRDHANQLDKNILNVVNKTKIFPEYVRGGDETEPKINTWTVTLWDSTSQRENVVEQPPQEVQAWTVAAILATKKRMDRLGLLPPMLT